jgi:hypothetical protein
LLRYADALGPARVVAALEDLASRRGTRFQPAAILIAMARSGANFYPGTVAGELPEDA